MEEVDLTALNQAVENMDHDHIADFIVSFLYRKGWSPTRVQYLVERLSEHSASGQLCRMAQL